MRVKMLADAAGSPDGVTVNNYSDGETYEVTAELGTVFVTYGFAEEAQDVKPKPRRNKATKPLENKQVTDD